MINDFLRHYLRNGSLFNKALDNIEKTERYSKEQVEGYQQEKIKYNIDLACNYTKYYKKLINELGVKKGELGLQENFRKIPFIDKHVVRNSLDDFKSDRINLLKYQAKTGGTTGTPCTFYRDLQSINYEYAFLWRQWKWGGRSRATKRVTLRGDIIIPIKQTAPPFWKYNKFSRELFLSSYHISEDCMAMFVDEINKGDYFDLYAYPSTAYLLADYCLRNRKSLSFKAIFTSSEILLPYQREVIEKVFGCKVCDWYGQVERVASIGQCEYGSYHIMEDYSYVELIPVSGNLYEVAGTSFFNKLMPLIRYKTGDIVEYNEEDSDCKCGRNFRKVKIVLGRETDYIQTPEGRKVSIVNHIPRGVENMIEVQFVQREVDELILRIACTGDFSQKDESLLIQNTKDHISHTMRYKIEKVDKIERSAQGKFIPILSELNKTKL